MTSFLRRGARASLGLCLLTCGALVLSVSCGSDDEKRKIQDQDGGGQGGAGEPSAPAGGAGNGGEPGTALGGAAGEATGAGGASAGAAGEPAAGAGGEPPVVACTPAGNVAGFALDHEPIYSVCRAARVAVPYDSAASGETFSCCGVSSSQPPLVLQLLGTPLQGNETTGGDLSFEVPSDAAVGSQFVNVTCNGTDTENVLALEVADTAAPVVTGATESLGDGTPMVVTGTHLAGVTHVRAVSSDGREFGCVIDEQKHTDTSVTCTFADLLPAASGYKLLVYQNNCGYALNTPTFEFLKSM